MPDIFLSYRRSDTGGHARTLYTHLNQRFPDRVFLDWEGIELGEDFVAKLEAIGRSCRVLLALIGRDWLSTTDAAGNRRITLAGDHVRREIERALERDIPVVPVLFDGATMPAEADLPEPLRPLAVRNAVSITNSNFGPDLERLTRGIEEILGEEQATVIHAVRKEQDWTSAHAFGKQVSVEYEITPKRKQILWITVGAVVLVAVILTVVALALLR
jgi:hypothetical protein